jgi:hypothetical protein
VENFLPLEWSISAIAHKCYMGYETKKKSC